MKVQMIEMVVNPSISEVSERFSAYAEMNEWHEPEVVEFFKDYFGSFSGVAELKEDNLIEQISQNVLEGKREIYVWDEMGKMSEMAYVRSMTPLPRPVVDLCCGYGYWISKIIRRVDLGIDVFPDNGRFSRDIAGIRIRNFIDDTYLAVLRHDVTKRLPINDNTVGTVMSICALEHIKDYKSALDEIKRILKPGGKLILTVDSPLLNEVLDEVFSQSYCEKFKAEHQLETLLSAKQWKEVLVETGFEVTDMTGFIDRKQTYLYLMTFFPTDFSSYWTKLGFTKLFRENREIQKIWEKTILPCLISPIEPDESMLICMTARAIE